MHDDSPEGGPSLASNRTLEIVVALVLLGLSSIVILDSARIGFGWASDGPQPGYFPFYVAVALAIASTINLLRAALRMDKSGRDSFVSVVAMGRVLSVLIPSLIYVGLIGWIGIYVASALFIIAFMMYFGREGLLKSTAVGVGVALALFMMFERWFLVPLPKGPLEALLGFG